MDTKSRLVVAGGWGWKGKKMSDGDQKVQTFIYKMNKFWSCNVQHGDYS